jgi:hypothetical protein
MVTSLVLVIAAMLPFSIYQMITSKPILLEILNALFTASWGSNLESRLGLFRAQGAFEHPILYGVVCALLFSIVYYTYWSRRNGLRIWSMSIIVISTFSSLSAGAFLSMAVQIILILWRFLTKHVGHRWKILTMVLVCAFTAVDAMSNRTAFEVFTTYLTFNTNNSYYRILIWNYGSQEVINNPIFGIGFNDWVRPSWMPESMDNFWLLTAVRYGLPGIGLLSAAITTALFQIGSAQSLDTNSSYVRTGLLISVIGTCVAICTVDLWNASYTLFMFIIGSGIWILDNGNLDNSINEQLDPGINMGKERAMKSLKFNRRP